VEIAGARGLDRRLIGAALRSVVSVEEVAADFRGVIDAHRTTIPRFLVDHVIEVPRGAAPSSCLPFYETLYGEIIDELDPSIVEKGSKQSVEKPGTLPGTSSSSEVREVTPAERIAFLLARQLCADGVYTVGSVTPLSMVAYQLAKQTHAPNLTLIPFAGLVDVGAYPVGIPSAERNAMSSAHGFWGMDDLYEWLYQAGKIDAEIFCPAQIDERGHINNSMVRRSDGTFARLPGQAGIADVATLHQNLYMYVPRHSTRRLVRRVDFEGGSRELITNEERAAVGLRGGEVTVVTDLCVFRLDKVRRVLVVDSIHSGVTPEEVKASTGFPLGVDRDVPRSPEPSAEILTLIRKVIDPLRVRDLETVGAADRMPLIREIVSGDAARSATSDPC
jgi:glutaconate CoA-transferase subunit A